MSFDYPEDLLQFIWEFQLFDQADLKTDSGQSITIVNQGFLNKNSGPDFENATIKIGETKHHGSVEIHIDSKDWKNHKHQNDPAYNTVVLHVCLTISADATREDGTSIPSLALEDKIDESSLYKYQGLQDSRSFIPCSASLSTLSSFDINNWVDRMTIERLEQRSQKMNSSLIISNGDWNSAFYCSIVRAFGMPINTEAFEEISLRLPYDLVQKHHQSLFQLEALFFGVAGLLNENSTDNYYTGLQKEYTFLKTKYKLQESLTLLKFGRMRPMNLPHVKIAQLAALFHHVPLFINKVLDLPDTESVHRLLNFNLSDYWSTHYSFSKESKTRAKKISPSFINHLFLNAIVPFVFFYEKNKTDADPEKAYSYLESLPSEKNKIITEWKSTGVACPNASTSQALLHLYKNYCKPKKCLQCNLGKKLLSK